MKNCHIFACHLSPTILWFHCTHCYRELVFAYIHNTRAYSYIDCFKREMGFFSTESPLGCYCITHVYQTGKYVTRVYFTTLNLTDIVRINTVLLFR